MNFTEAYLTRYRLHGLLNVETTEASIEIDGIYFDITWLCERGQECAESIFVYTGDKENIRISRMDLLVGRMETSPQIYDARLFKRQAPGLHAVIVDKLKSLNDPRAMRALDGLVEEG